MEHRKKAQGAVAPEAEGQHDEVEARRGPEAAERLVGRPGRGRCPPEVAEPQGEQIGVLAVFVDEEHGAKPILPAVPFAHRVAPRASPILSATGVEADPCYGILPSPVQAKKKPTFAASIRRLATSWYSNLLRRWGKPRKGSSNPQNVTSPGKLAPREGSDSLRRRAAFAGRSALRSSGCGEGITSGRGAPACSAVPQFLLGSARACPGTSCHGRWCPVPR